MSDKQLIKKIAELYFKEKMTQKEIARDLNTSQSTISRYIKIALQKNIVNREQHSKEVYEDRRELLICEKYDLKKVFIVNYPDLETSTGIPFFRRLGEKAAEYLEDILKPDMQVSVAHGRSIYYAIKALNERRMRINVDPLMLIRGMGIEEGKLPAWVNSIMFGTKFWMDHTWEQIIPQYLEDTKGENLYKNAESMLKKPIVKQALERISKSDVILQGVGPLYKEATFVKVAIKLGIEYHELVKEGVVGSICHTPVDKDGNPIKLLNLHKLAITIPLEKLRELSRDINRHIILIAGGIEKLEIITTTLKGRYCNVFVTDESVAEHLLREDDD